jgi:hypothetical protein
MDQQHTGRFEVQVEEDVPRGGLYQLEQRTWYRVVDRSSLQVVMTFQGQVEASLSPDSGMWEDLCGYGVRDVTIAHDERSVLVRYYDGRKEMALLPP